MCPQLLSKFRMLPVFLVFFSFTLYSHSLAYQGASNKQETCTCCMSIETCQDQNSKCKTNSSCPKDSCPCPPHCGTNTGTSILGMVQKAIEGGAPHFSLTRMAPTDTNYEARFYRPPIPPPKGIAREG